MKSKFKQDKPNEDASGVKVLKNEGFLRLSRINCLFGQ